MLYSAAMTWQYLGERPEQRPLLARLIGVAGHLQAWRAIAERELRLRYVGSTLGLAWAVVHPLLFVGAYTVIFAFVFRARLAPDAPRDQYALYVVLGLLPWVAVTDVATRATEAMATHRSLVKHVRFPLEVVPLYSLAASLLSLLVGLLVLLPVLGWRQGGLPWGAVGLPLILLAQVAFTVGLAWLLGAVGAFLRDIKELVQITFMIGMFLTPIFYVESVLPAPLRPIIWLNPLAHLATLYRGALLTAMPFDALPVVVFSLASLFTLVVGFAVFERARKLLTDLL
ncbi:MAG: hypothetical protein CL878_13115 [Dehalococcoidia bacterium]|nr:hypothetical protein [Dehalococcoidia bacterium]